MSKATAQLLVRQAPDLRKCVTRRSGQQAIKGKGFMRTYWLHTRPVSLLLVPPPAAVNLIIAAVGVCPVCHSTPSQLLYRLSTYLQ